MPEPTTRWRLLDRYRVHLVEVRYREQRTWLEYRRTLLDFWAHAGKEPDQVTARDLHRFLDRKLADATRSTYAVHVKAFYRWAAAAKLLAVDPLAGVRTPRVPLGPPRSLDLADIERLIASAYSDAQLHTMAWLAYGAGLRCAEIAGLRLEDCRTSGDYPHLRVRGKGRRERVIPLHPAVARVLAAALEGRPHAGPVVESRVDLGRPIGAKHVSRRLAEALHALGITATGHQLRHTFATQILAAGGGTNLRAVSRLLGHSSTEVTERYVSAYSGDAVEAVNLLPDPSPKGLPDRRLRAVP